MIKYLVTAGAVVAIGIGASACGTGDEQATAAEPTTTSTIDTGPAADATGSAVSDGASINADLAATYAEAAPGALAKLCANPLPDSMKVTMLRKELGSQIIRGGGDPSEVVEILFDRC